MVIPGKTTWGIETGNTGKYPREVKMINGVKHVFNPGTPLKGEITLNLEPSLKIDPENVKGLEDIIFNYYERDTHGNIYLVDAKSVHIHKFSADGKYLKSFLQKGSGPGEFEPFPRINIVDENIWVIGQNKAAKFTLDGRLVDELKFNNYYRPITIIDANRFVANYEVYDNKDRTDRTFKKYTGLFDIKSQKCLLNFFEAENPGRVFIPVNDTWMAVVPSPGIIPDIIYELDHSNNCLFISLNGNYEICQKNLKGETLMVIHKAHTNGILKESDKKDVIGAFGSVPEDIEKKLIDILPGKLCAIERIDMLPSGYLLVKGIRNYHEYSYDIFCSDGVYLYRLDLSNISSLLAVNFYKQTLAGIVEKEDGNTYYQYKIKSHREIFD